MSTLLRRKIQDEAAGVAITFYLFKENVVPGAHPSF